MRPKADRRLTTQFQPFSAEMTEAMSRRSAPAPLADLYLLAQSGEINASELEYDIHDGAAGPDDTWRRNANIVRAFSDNVGFLFFPLASR